MSNRSDRKFLLRLKCPIQDRSEIVRGGKFVEFLRSEIRSTTASALFSGELQLLVNSKMSTSMHGPNLESSAIRRKIRSAFSSGAIRAIRIHRGQSADFNVMAMRMAIVCQMYDMLKEDGSVTPVLQSIPGSDAYAGSSWLYRKMC